MQALPCRGNAPFQPARAAITVGQQFQSMVAVKFGEPGRGQTAGQQILPAPKRHHPLDEIFAPSFIAEPIFLLHRQVRLRLEKGAGIHAAPVTGAPPRTRIHRYTLEPAAWGAAFEYIAAQIALTAGRARREFGKRIRHVERGIVDPDGTNVSGATLQTYRCARNAESDGELRAQGYEFEHPAQYTRHDVAAFMAAVVAHALAQ